MPVLRNKLFFDTQIVSHAASGIIPGPTWKKISRYISRKCRYCISLITLYELIGGIAGGDDAHFEKNRDRLRMLCLPYRTLFLPLVGDFVRDRVFRKLPRRQDFHPDRLRLWPRIILRAKDKAQLKSGAVSLNKPGHSQRRYGFDLALLQRQVREGKANHSRALAELRSGVLRRSPRQIWASSVLERIEVPVNTPNVQRLLAALDAAYCYDESLWTLAEEHTYDFARHDSDWLDEQQLFYLADPTVLFVTSDEKIRQRTSNSNQASRILSFDQLKTLADV